MPKIQAAVNRHLAHAVAVLNKLKTSAGCMDCGFNAWPESLHFDHLDPHTKRYALGWQDDRSKLTSRARLRAYLDHVDRYCVVRCANCHAHRTHQEQQWRVRRGSLAPTGTDGADGVDGCLF